MGAFDRVIEAFVEERLLQLHTAAPCRIVSFDEVAGRAVVQPLFMEKEVGKEPQPAALIRNVRVLKQRFRVGNGEEQVYVPLYEPDDLVFVAFAERPMAGMGSSPFYPSGRHHSTAGAVILGVIS